MVQPPPEVIIIITGTAGSGKSYLINAIKALLGDTCILKATAGLAGYNIEGCTLHSALQLPVRNHNNNDLNGTALQRHFSGKQYLMLPHPSPVLYSHSMDIPFMVYLKQWSC